MYKPYYKLSFNPFQLRHESAFFWASEWHSSILEELRASILEKRGFFVLTSPEGFGKTCLTETAIERLEDRVESCFITLKSDNVISFYNTILAGFGSGTQVSTKIQFYLQITDCLQKIRQQNRIGLLVVDNAHLLSQELLEELRHVSNIENDGVKLINIFLVGNDSINTLLDDAQNSALRQKIMFHGEVPTLSDSEIREYIEHRIRVAGATTMIFNDNALKQLAIYTSGVAKTINILCETALIIGYKRGANPVDDLIVLDAARELKLQPSQKRANNQGEKKNTSSKSASFEENHTKEDGFSSPKKKKNWTLTVIVSSLVSIACLFYLFPELLKFPLTGAGSSVEIGVLIPKGTTNPKIEVAKDSKKENINNEQQVESVRIDETVASNVFDVNVDGEKRKEPSEIVLNYEKSDDLKIVNKDEPIKNETLTETNLVVEEISWDRGQLSEREIIPESSSETLENKSNVVIEANNDRVEKDFKDEALQKKNEEKSEVGVSSHLGGADFEDDVDQNVEIIDIYPTSSKTVVFLLEGTLILETKPNSSEITKEGLRELNAFAERLLQHPKAIIQIEGYISSKNNSLENTKLSERRANIVRDYLLAQGITNQQMVVNGMGNQNPRATNDTYEGRKKNRRVEISVINDLCHLDEQE